jgi:hypothetical protein
VIVEVLDLRVLKGHKELEGLLDQLALQVELELKVLEDLLDVEAQQESQEHKGLQAHKVKLETQVVTEAYLCI